MTSRNTEKRSVAEAIGELALWVKYLGGGMNSDPRGAVEFLAISVKEGAETIGRSIDNLADAIRERGGGD